jgi:hypothetical protein
VVVRNLLGENIAGTIMEASDLTSLSPQLILAMLISQSVVNPFYECWGSRTREASMALAALNGEIPSHRDPMLVLSEIIGDEAPMIAFGYCGIPVGKHWWGDGTYSVINTLNVRKAVFASPQRDILEGAKMMASLGRVNEVDCLLGFSRACLRPADRKSIEAALDLAYDIISGKKGGLF